MRTFLPQDDNLVTVRWTTLGRSTNFSPENNKLQMPVLTTAFIYYLSLKKLKTTMQE